MTYPTIMPALTLDFQNSQQLDSRVTFSRTQTTGQATYINSAGQVAYANSDESRFEFDSNGNCLGLLIEESRTNLIPYSEDFNNAAWAKRNITFTSNTATAPDGNTTADKIAPNSGTVYPADIYASFTITTPLTLSVWAKADGFNVINLNLGNYGDNGVEDAFLKVNVNTGTLVESTGSAGGFWTSYSITPHSNGWYRITATTTDTTDGNAVVQFQVCEDDGSQVITSGDGAKGILIWGAQLEEGSFPTSYIPTSGSTVTRAIDIALITGDNFSSWYNQSEGTVLLKATTLTTDPKTFFYICDASSAASDRISHDTNSLKINSGGTAIINRTISAYYPYNSAIAYKANNFATSERGVVQTVSSGAVPSNVDIAYFYHPVYSQVHPSYHISRLSYYNERLTDAELQTITS